MSKIDNDLGIASYDFGQWEMFKRISDEAVDEFLGYMEGE